MDLLVQARWVQSTSELRSCLDPKLDNCTQCRGHSKNKPTCGNPISRASRSQIAHVLQDIIKSGSILSAAKHLQQLASLVLCKRWHQTQVAEKVAEWTTCLRSFLEVKPSPTKKKADTEKPSSATTSCLSKQPERRAIRILKIPQPITKTEEASGSAKPIKEEHDEKDVRLDSLAAYKKPIPHSGAETKPRIHYFEPYQRPKTAGRINNDIVEKLTAPFNVRERKAADKGDGYIYGYKLPRDHHERGGGSCRMIKIGYTNNPQRRMREWGVQCSYEPQVNFTIRSAYYVKIEEIIHLQLHNERRKERCSVCYRQHHEFFEIDTSRAEAVVRMWTRWAQLQPFDDDGRLSKYWSLKLADLDMEDPDCWERFLCEKVKQGGKSFLIKRRVEALRFAC
ncbi:hypothetical protein CkaCkLH20_00438 [Colletotrichum karsti]|uniref:Bacteriophage T5 Orf172 DNA-binding domain-containing protein n=1 Tax=Colletotrichum karsti TaxID=1095194 RepID=A0A9P6IFG1_9PEZI|nr:uncharacterized protein CkaCkLH20_00438 [Colletotrichum karsti]KAF9882402.1 hypothetical protein CkaCkLH20_00438 [Colletotrichum karsti]